MSTVSSRLVRLLGGLSRAALVETRAASTSVFGSNPVLHAYRAMPLQFGTVGVGRNLMFPQPLVHHGFAAAGSISARGIATSTAIAAAKKSKDSGTSEVQKASWGDRYDEITDKWIPEKPVSKVEAGGYSLIIAAGLAVALGAVWYSLKELVLEPTEQTVFAEAVKKAEVDPRGLVRVGTPMTAYGKEGRSRSARSRLAHSKSTDGNGVEHIRVQGAVRGPHGKGTVHCDAFKEASGTWQFEYLVVDVGRDRVVVVQPQAKPGIMRVPEKVYTVGD